MKLLLGFMVLCGLLTGCEPEENIILTDESTHTLYVCWGNTDSSFHCSKVDSPPPSERK
jgi:hypothetical protein